MLFSILRLMMKQFLKINKIKSDRTEDCLDLFLAHNKLIEVSSLSMTKEKISMRKSKFSIKFN